MLSSFLPSTRLAELPEALIGEVSVMVLSQIRQAGERHLVETRPGYAKWWTPASDALGWPERPPTAMRQERVPDRPDPSRASNVITPSTAEDRRKNPIKSNIFSPNRRWGARVQR